DEPDTRLNQGQTEPHRKPGPLLLIATSVNMDALIRSAAGYGATTPAPERVGDLGGAAEHDVDPVTGPRTTQIRRCGGVRLPLSPAAGAGYDVRSRTWRTVAAYHRAPPWAVGTPASFRSSAISRRESPGARCL